MPQDLLVFFAKFDGEVYQHKLACGKALPDSLPPPPPLSRELVDFMERQPVTCAMGKVKHVQINKYKVALKEIIDLQEQVRIEVEGKREAVRTKEAQRKLWFFALLLLMAGSIAVVWHVKQSHHSLTIKHNEALALILKHEEEINKASKAEAEAHHLVTKAEAELQDGKEKAKFALDEAKKQLSVFEKAKKEAEDKLTQVQTDHWWNTLFYTVLAIILTAGVVFIISRL